MSPENSKPEWFHMADADPIPSKPKSKKGIRMMALATPLLILGAGLAYAQTQDTSPAEAGRTVASAANSIAIARASNAAAPTITKPGLATMPATDDGQERSSEDD